MFVLYPNDNSIKYAGNKKIKPAEIIVWRRAICDNSNFFFLNRAEYIAQENIATTIHKSPLLKFKFNKTFKFAFVIITTTPESEKMTPNIWKILVFSILKSEQNIIIITGIVEIIKTPLITWVKFNE